jgi:outer membrane protein assembly factor BamB
MNTTKIVLLAGLLAHGQYLLAADSAETAPKTPPPKITHDWPSYYGPDGTYADPSMVPLLDDLAQAKLLWISEHDDLGHGKTSSKGGHAYGPKSKAAGSADLIVAGGLVIAGHFSPKNNVVADEVILALDATTGKTKWKQVYAGKGYHRTAGKHTQYGPSPAAADGKVFHLGSGGRIYCVELSSGKPLWDVALGDYPEQYKKAAAEVPVKEGVKEGVHVGTALYDPLTVIGGVLMVTVAGDGVYGYETATGKHLWIVTGAARTPSPAKIGGNVYALCSGRDNLQLVEPRSGKVLWTEKVGTIVARPPFIVADGRAFVPLVPEKVGEKAILTTFALSPTGAKPLWRSKDALTNDDSVIYGYRDGVYYLNINQKMSDVRILALKADDGTILNDFKAAQTNSVWGQFHLWGDRLVLIGDHCHESIGHQCYYQMLTLGPKDWKITGHPFALRGIRQYVGVCGYDSIWMRPAFADGLIFTRSVNRETGRGSILCWDLRARPASTWMKFRVQDPVPGILKAQNHADVEAELEAGKVARLFMTIPQRTSTPEKTALAYARGFPRESTPLAAGRWKGEVDMELERDVDFWQFDLDASGAAPSGTYRRTIAALARPTDVEGAADAKEETRPGGTKRWIINLKQAACLDPDAPADKRRDMYIVIDRTAAGEQESWSRSRLLNIATHDVDLTGFAADEKTLTCKGTVLFHSDKYTNPSTQRPGVVAMEVDVALTRDGESWKGTYKGRYGSAWTGTGKIYRESVGSADRGPPNRLNTWETRNNGAA